MEVIVNPPQILLDTIVSEIVLENDDLSLFDLKLAALETESEIVQSIPENVDKYAYKIINIESKGVGMIATRKLYPGDLILAEKPVFIVPNAIFDDAERCEKFVGIEIDKLNNEERELVFSLTNCRQDPKPFCGLFYTNAMILGEEACLCPIMAKANHSCRANSEFISKTGLGMLHLMANYIINPGEEITINYMAMEDEGSDTKETRQAYLSRFYGFHCSCLACTLQDKDILEDKAVREDIKELQAAGPDNLDPPELEMLISKVYQINGKHSYILALLYYLIRSAPVGSFQRLHCAVSGFTIAVNLYGSTSNKTKEWRNQLDFQKIF